MIYDIFTFNDELEILELRLNIHNDIVDKFIIVESNKNFFMRDKPLHYLENQHLFENFKDKIIHVNIDMIDHGHAFYNDYYQKSLCIDYLLNIMNSDDIAYISDADEILNITHVESFQNGNRLKPICGIAKFLHYFINVEVNTAWYNGIVCTKRHLDEFFKGNVNHTLCRKFRDSRANLDIFDIKNNYGYHYTWLVNKQDGINNIYKKLQSHSHMEMKNITLEHIKKCIDNLKPLNESSQPWKLTTFELNDNTCPKYILNNINKYKHLIYQ